MPNPPSMSIIESRRVAPVAPRHPAVPAEAPGALRLPIVEVKST